MLLFDFFFQINFPLDISVFCFFFHCFRATFAVFSRVGAKCSSFYAYIICHLYSQFTSCSSVCFYWQFYQMQFDAFKFLFLTKIQFDNLVKRFICTHDGLAVE